ncbi:MAG: N-acetylmuramoyl-L-alanine amidase, partial [Ginsengibacter sp.]
IMITLSWYLLKVIICSGILCGYYFLALRNKAFHRWNRFYILAAIIISLLAPVMKINIFQNDADKGTVVHVLQTISYGDEAVIEYSRNNQFHLSTHNLGEVAYVLVSAIFLAIFFVSLYKIKRLRKKYPETKIEEVSFINTNAKGTPFSFFNSIFWNNAIDLHSKSGQQIFNHEIAHVKEKHSYDKIFMNIVLIFFWINPFFWLMRKELYMIHEFIADKEALEDSDVSAFAEMVLQTVYPGQKFSLNNQFFYSPLKRRIMMLAKNKNPKVSYISRLLVLPLTALVFFAFTLKVKNGSNNLYKGKTITVIIDAGHGGNDNGAIFNGIKEKDINLSIAQKIADLNSNPNLKIILSRDDDQNISLKDRLKFSNTNNADLFISIHTNATVNNEQLNGFSVLIGRNNTEQDQLLGSALINELKKSYKTEDKIETRDRGVWILNHNVCPAAIVECGFLSNSGDAAFINNSDDQEKIAENILNAINIYASSEENSVSKSAPLVVNNSPGAPVIKDSIPSMNYKGKKVTGLLVNDLRNTVNVTYDDGSKEMISKEEADKRGFVLPPPPPPGLPPSYFKSNALFVIDGKISTNQKAKEIDPKNIESINILKEKKGIDKYGQKGKNGVIEIITKNKNYSVSGNTDTLYMSGSSSFPIKSDLKIKSKVAYISSKFPDGTLIFADGKEISQDEMKDIPPNTIQSVKVLKGESVEKKYGEKGKNGAIEITTKSHIPLNTLLIVDGKELPREDLDKIQPTDIESISVLKDKSATKKYGIAGKDGVIEITTKKNLPMLTLIDTIPKKVYIKVENEASFPGGLQAWSKYISKAIQDSISNFTEADYGTCLIRFIVNTDGRV